MTDCTIRGRFLFPAIGRGSCFRISSRSVCYCSVASELLLEDHCSFVFADGQGIAVEHKGHFPTVRGGNLVILSLKALGLARHVESTGAVGIELNGDLEAEALEHFGIHGHSIGIHAD